MNQTKQTKRTKQRFVNSVGDLPIKKRSRLKRWLFSLIAIVTVVGFLVIIFNLLPSIDAVLNLNRFLFTHYGAFLIMRLFFYGVMSFVVLKMKKQVMGTPYFRSFCRTCALCVLMVVLNEVMLLIRVMGA